MSSRAYAPKSFDGLFGMKGLSEALLSDHLSLYMGYVSNVNKLGAALRKLAEEEKTETPEFAEMTRRYGWEFDGMRLHELYFGNLNPVTRPPKRESRLYRQIQGDFGGFEAWEREFRGIGAMRGIGWAVLYLDPSVPRVLNAWIDQHHAGHLSGCRELLVLDVFEHAYIRDYGLERKEYIDAFFEHIDWDVVAARMA